MGFDQAFQRKWVYYLSYCEAGFATRTLGDLQLVLTRLFNRNLPLGR
jgi:cyclopropane-fatty-acyl-phospholipid synthase